MSIISSCAWAPVPAGAPTAGSRSATATEEGVLAALADPEEVRLHLVAAARAGTALSYGELLERLGYSFSRPKMRALCRILAVIDEAAELRGEPELAVLVVRQSDGLPGQGWWVAGGARSRGYDGPWEGPEARRFIGAVQSESFGFWQSRSGTESIDTPG